MLRFYRRSFYVALVVIACLIGAMVFIMYQEGFFSHHKILAPNIGDAGPLPVTVTQTLQKVEVITPLSISVSWESSIDKRMINQTFVIDPNTKVYEKESKASTTVAQEQDEFQKKLHLGVLPLIQPLTYTLKAAALSALKPGMLVHIQEEPVASSTKTMEIRAATILIEQSELSTTTQGLK